MRQETIAERLAENGIAFHGELPEKLAIYLRLLQEWNEKMDLTAVAGEDDLLDFHFLDSLTVMKTGFLEKAGSLIDVGTGAGFPGMVLALALPETRVTLLDSQRKRLTFLETVIRETEAANVTLVHARAEDGARQPELREAFDLACARAVAPLNVLCELLLPYVRVGGSALCWKGPAAEAEMGSGRRAAFLLGGKIGTEIECGILGRDWNHRIIPVSKERPTPKAYPRKPGIPKKSPLGASE